MYESMRRKDGNRSAAAGRVWSVRFVSDSIYMLGGAAGREGGGGLQSSNMRGLSHAERAIHVARNVAFRAPSSALDLPQECGLAISACCASKAALVGRTLDVATVRTCGWCRGGTSPLVLAKPVVAVAWR